MMIVCGPEDAAKAAWLLLKFQQAREDGLGGGVVVQPWMGAGGGHDAGAVEFSCLVVEGPGV